MNIISIILAAIGLAAPDRTETQMQDDNLAGKVADILDKSATPLLIVAIVGLVTTCISLYGAVSFKLRLVSRRKGEKKQ
jgi:hypothetical protein